MVEETRQERAERLGIELAAVSDPWRRYKEGDEPRGASEGEVETSKAISAKRQADALERIAGILTACEWEQAISVRRVG